MAAWQCSFLVVPGHPTTAEVRSGVHGAVWDDRVQVEQVRRIATETLGRAESWSPKIDIWGDETSNCLKMIRDNDQISEIVLRVDLRGIDVLQLARILKGLHQAGVALLGEDGRRSEATLHSVREALERSKAWGFVRDPRAFIASIAEAEALN
jgi:hypothetical protein